MTADNRKILLIEDNPMDVDLTLRAFSRREAKHTIEVAEDGETAMSLVDAWECGRAAAPSLVLLDLKLHKVDGLDVLRRIKSHPTLRVITVVILSTSAEDHDVRRAYELGANSYIVKPVNFDQFLSVVEHIDHYWRHVNHAYHH